jgi:hypothetical protein
MKQPRTSDFDPNAKSKPLKSSMDDMPSIEKPPLLSKTDVTPALAPTPAPAPAVQPVLPVRDVLLSPTGRRKIKSRHPFDIYEDQVDELKKLSLEDRMRGGNGSMSAMVREALDTYISSKRG